MASLAARCESSTSPGAISPSGQRRESSNSCNTWSSLRPRCHARYGDRERRSPKVQEQVIIRVLGTAPSRISSPDHHLGPCALLLQCLHQDQGFTDQCRWQVGTTAPHSGCQWVPRAQVRLLPTVPQTPASCCRNTIERLLPPPRTWIAAAGDGFQGRQFSDSTLPKSEHPQLTVR